MEFLRQVEYQKYYEELKIVYDKGGLSHLQTQLLKAFTQYLIDACTGGATIDRLGILKHMALMCNQMMLREFEVIIWACLNSKEQLEQEGIIGKESKEGSTQKLVFYRLLMTAFFLKEKFCKQ
jgi:hypothetical protein